MALVTPEELLKYPPPKPPAWITSPRMMRYPLPCPEYQVQILEAPTRSGKPGNPYWTSNPGPQTWSLLAPFDEIVCGGSRGGGKSAVLISWFAMGDQRLDPDDPAHYSYLLEPSYRGLMLRKEYQSMAEFVDEASDFFGPLGGKKKNEPTEFHFKSGAIIYTNHLGDAKAFEKYRGWGISRIGIEELTQIEEERWYLKLLGSLRAKKQIRIHAGKEFAALRSQIMSTTNPDGPGRSWVRKRFVKVLDSKGNIIPTNTPMKDKITGLSRIFIPMSRMDNRYLRNDKQYEGMLLSQDEVTRKQWIDGDWDAGSGAFFSEFRPQGPLGPIEQEKYPWARHVVPPVDLRPWWYRFGGGDWGYSHPAAFHKFCRSERDGRINVYDELVLRGCGSFEMGVRLAHWWMPDLEGLPNKSVTIAFSPDAFATTDSGKTKVEQMADGIASVLGPYGAFLLKYTDDERKAMESNPANAQRMIEGRIASAAQGKMQIVLKRASTDTVARWSYVRELLRFRPIVQETEQELRERVTERFQRSGLEAYERELLKIRRPQDEHLPKLHIWKDRCPGLVRCIEEAMEDEANSEKVAKKDAVDGVGGDDCLDSACHGLHHFKEIEKVMPKSYFVSERMEQIQAGFERDFGERLTDPNRLIMIQQTQSARYDNAHPSQSGGFTPARMSSSRHRKPN
jgi:hypothetical protein